MRAECGNTDTDTSSAHKETHTYIGADLDTAETFS